MKILTLVGIVLSLIGCAIIDTQNPVDMLFQVATEYPESYTDGYNDACKYKILSPGYHITKNEKAYFDGWKAGLASCK